MKILTQSAAEPFLGQSVAEKGAAVRTVAKALMILDLFSEETPSLRLADIAERAGLDRSTAYRMLQTLCEFGYPQCLPLPACPAQAWACRGSGAQPVALQVHAPGRALDRHRPQPFRALPHP
jgi:hypothetical protein